MTVEEEVPLEEDEEIEEEGVTTDDEAEVSLCIAARGNAGSGAVGQYYLFLFKV